MEQSPIPNNVVIGKNHRLEQFVLIGQCPPGKTFEPLRIGENAVIRSHSVLYAGNIIGNNFQTGHGVMVRENNLIGNDVSIGTHSVVERDNIIGDGVRIHSNCFIPEFVEIGKKAWLGPGVVVLNTIHPPCPSFEECARSNYIGENAKIGGNVTLMPRVRIGKNSLIGAGSVVTRDIPDNVVAVGSPARVMKSLDDLDCLLHFYDTPYEWEERA